jgi:hypothetical protein
MPNDPDPTPAPEAADSEAPAAREPYRDLAAAIGGARELVDLLRSVVDRLEARIDAIDSALREEDWE